MKCLILGIGVLIASLGAPFPASAGEGGVPKYQFVDIGTLGGVWTSGYAINDSGQVTGASQTPAGVGRAFIWDAGYMEDLGSLGDSWSEGSTLNNLGQVAGYSETHPSFDLCGGRCAPRVFLWDEGLMVGHDHPDFDPYWLGSWVDAINSAGQVIGYYGSEMGYDFNAFVWDGKETKFIEIPGSEHLGMPWSRAVAINDLGEVAGHIVTREYWEGCWDSRAFIWNSETSQSRLLDMPSEASDINESGQVVGNFGRGWVFCNGESLYEEVRGFLWDGDSFQDLGGLGGEYTRPLRVNASGAVTGLSDTAGGYSRHVFYWESGVMRDLGRLGDAGIWFTYPWAMSNSGVVTGRSGGRAFVSDGTPMQDLNELISDTISNRPLLREGRDINEVGQVLANGIDPLSLRSRAYVLTPISLLFSRLLDDATGVGPGKTLERRVANAITYYDAEDLEATCSSLEGFVSQVGTFAGQRNAKVTADEAEKLIGHAYAIHAALGCP